ncbi:hypothetical protein PMAYCL1PPCAC_24471 [Pristionchus mayeri]|uniref:Uncharacterized protein n=1 Tax=Pristionchus mayeri TaxID=1317129 RepID=A0AAN5CZY5_9BILA|nr:hypothetical protein PMAYCL1PPCAC_24471 [Pristionchus mayeri]
MSESREKWHESELRVMVNFIYCLLKGRFDRELMLIRNNNFSYTGPTVWSLFVRLQQDEEWDLGECNHSAASCTTKWSRKLQKSLHEVEGVAPEKVLFIYFKLAIKLPKEAPPRISNRFTAYELTWRDCVLKDYQKKVNFQVEIRRQEQESERQRKEKEEKERRRREEEEKERKKREEEENERKKIEKERKKIENERKKIENERKKREERERNERQKIEERKRQERMILEENERRMWEKEEGKRKGMREVGATVSPPGTQIKKIRKEEEREGYEKRREMEGEDRPHTVPKKVKRDMRHNEEEEDSNEDGEESGGGSESGTHEYSNSDLRVMVNFVHDFMSGRCDKKFMAVQQEMRKSQAGDSDIWQCLARLQEIERKGRSEGSISPTRCKEIWRKYLMRNLHKVEGMMPEKVLFIYKELAIKLSSRVIRRICDEYSGYELTWSNGVLTQFKKSIKRGEADGDGVEGEESNSNASRNGMGPLLHSTDRISMSITPTSSPKRNRKGPVEDESPDRIIRRSPRKKQSTGPFREWDTVASKEPIDGREKRKEASQVHAAAASSPSSSSYRRAASKTTTSAETMDQLWEEMDGGGTSKGGVQRDYCQQSGAPKSVPRRTKITVGEGGDTVAGIYEQVRHRSNAQGQFQPVKETQEEKRGGPSMGRRVQIEEASEEENAGTTRGMQPPEVPQQHVSSAARALLRGRPTPAAIVAQLDRPAKEGEKAGGGGGGVSLAFRQRSRAGQNALKNAVEAQRGHETETRSPILKQLKKGEEATAVTAAAAAPPAEDSGSKEMGMQPEEDPVLCRIRKAAEKREEERMMKEKEEKKRKEKMEKVAKMMNTTKRWENLRESRANRANIFAGDEELPFGVWNEMLEWDNEEEHVKKKVWLARTIGEMNDQEDPKLKETTRSKLFTKMAGWKLEKAVDRALDDDSLWD